MKNKNHSIKHYSHLTHRVLKRMRREFLAQPKKIVAVASIFALLFFILQPIFTVREVRAVGIDDMTAVIPEGSDAISTDGTITITFPTSVLVDAEVFTFYVGDVTGGAEWVLNSVTTGDAACTDDGTAEVYTTDSTTAATATEPMQVQFTGTDITDGTLTTCTIGDGTPDPTSPDTAGVYSVAMVTTSDSGAASIYVADVNDVTVSTTVLSNMAISIDNADGTFCTTASSVTTCDMGIVTTSTVVTGNYDVNGGTNAITDMTIQIAEDGDLGTIDDVVNDTTVTGDGTEEYGVAISGVSAEWQEQGNYGANDTPIASGPVDFMTSVGPASQAGEDITVTHRASIATDTAYGVHSHIVTYTALGNF